LGIVLEKIDVLLIREWSWVLGSQACTSALLSIRLVEFNG